MPFLWTPENHSDRNAQTQHSHTSQASEEKTDEQHLLRQQRLKLLLDHDSDQDADFLQRLHSGQHETDYEARAKRILEDVARLLEVARK
ncbi:hypothetical protein MN608_09148 [Microdochium nivale]|nr:hypothetical protein MN608_09148 [Microdochium nivale]